MHVRKVKVQNFRLLNDVEMVLEDGSTLVVGRNNSGKTSLSEVIRRFMADQTPRFHIEDFSNACYDKFSQALEAKNAGEEEDAVRALLPGIELRVLFFYDPEKQDLGPLSDFIVDLDAEKSEALAVSRYELRDGSIDALFEGQPSEDLTDETRPGFFRAIRDRIPDLFEVKTWAEDPHDPTNRRQLPHSALRGLIRTGFITAQRGLDDNTSRETDILARILEGLFATAASPTSDERDKLIAQALQEAVRDIQDRIDTDFNTKLKSLLPTLATFGYPGLGGPELATETTLDVKKLLSNHTKVRYAGHHGILLPESYNGLGVRNLVFILLQIVSFYRAFRAEANAPAVHLIFIEEPEAHLHPQMQEVFIRQLGKIAQQLNEQEGAGLPWPVQFIVSTHSSHVANAAGFESIRYFLPAPSAGAETVRQTKIKDLRDGLKSTAEDDKKFLHQYLTLTRCDLFFADKAVLVEGTSERLLLPVMIRKMEEGEPEKPKLSTQYMTIMEVGGAYAHIFFDLLDFLELRSLIITDIDSVIVNGGSACVVHEGTSTSNACLKAWFAGEDCSPAVLCTKTRADKVKGLKCIAFQRSETDGGPCGRTFEDAFMLANPAMFGIADGPADERAKAAANLAEKLKKSEFALKHAIDETGWTAPVYISEGLRWLADDPPTGIDDVLAATPEALMPGEAGDPNV